jgi:DNA-binding MarR family transcriptional regulator
MNSVRKRLIDYLAAVSGERLELSTEPAAKLPLFLRERYDIQSTRLFGRRFLLALEKESKDTGTPSEYESQAAALSGKFGEPVTMVIPALPSYTRNRMVRMGIPFIVPGRQIFLPTALIDLRERQPIPRRTGGGRLTPAAQCLILYHLQRGSLAAKPLQEIAKIIRYSPIMLTKVKAELETAGICESVRHGRSITLHFLREGRELWNHAEALLSRPDGKHLWGRWEKPGPQYLLAGISALSRRTMIEKDRVPTYALWKDQLRPDLAKGVFHDCRGREEANVCIEAWAYDPLILSQEETVDPLSLFLSLRDSPDERVQQQLEKLIEGVAW